MDDAQLLEAWRAGDRAAGDQLFARHFDTVYGFFQRRVAGDVADLVQRTFLGLVEAKDRMRGEASVRTFLFVIARRELWAHYRQRTRDAEIDFEVSSVADLAPTPSSILRRGDERALLLEALRRVPLELQLAIELHYWEDLSGPEIAHVLDVPEGTVRSRLRRGLEALQRRLAELSDEPRAEWQSEASFETWARALRPGR